MQNLTKPFAALLLAKEYTPSNEEIEFARKLGIKFPNKFPHDKQIYVDRVDTNDGSWVDIYVTCFPARSYEFIVYNCVLNKIFRIRTGITGDINSYWQIAESVLYNKNRKLKFEQWTDNFNYYKIEEIKDYQGKQLV